MMNKDELLLELRKSLVESSTEDREVFIVAVLGMAGVELVNYKKVLENFGMDTSSVDRILLVTSGIIHYTTDKLEE